MRRPTNVMYAAVAMIGFGGLLLFLAWDGAASVGGAMVGIDYTQGQIPFLISGGIGGLALIGVGLTLIIVHSIRRDLAALGGKLDRVVDAIRESDGLFAGPTAVPSAEGEQVVAGRTTYHEPTCHIVEGRDDLRVMAPETASEHGLAPCRICEPVPPMVEASEETADETVDVQRIASA